MEVVVEDDVLVVVVAGAVVVVVVDDGVGAVVVVVAWVAACEQPSSTRATPRSRVNPLVRAILELCMSLLG